MTDFELRSSRDSDEAHVAVRGEIDMATAPQVRDLLTDLVTEGARTIVIDCRELQFLDSSGIGVLVAIRERLGAVGSIVLDSPTDHVRKVLEITGVTPHITVIP